MFSPEFSPNLDGINGENATQADEIVKTSELPSEIQEAIDRGEFADRVIVFKNSGRLKGTLSLDPKHGRREWFNSNDKYGIADLVEQGDTIRIVKEGEDVIGIIHNSSLIWKK